MRVSVIIPAYRAAETICRAVDSVLAQSHPADEIIIVDDGSPDHQVEVIERAYGHVPHVTLIRQLNGKTAKARNTGIDHATGNFIAFLDADDYWEPEKLATQLQVFQSHPAVGLVAGMWFSEVPGEARVLFSLRRDERDQYDRVLQAHGERAFHLATSVWTGTVIVRRDVVGGNRFVSGLEPAEDRDFWVRIVKEHPIYLMSTPLATAVLEPESISRSGAERDCVSMLKVVNRNAALLGRSGTCLWRSYTLYRWAAIENNPMIAIPRLLASFIHWPLPYSGKIYCRPLGRTKRLVTLAASLLHGKRGTRGQ